MRKFLLSLFAAISVTTMWAADDYLHIRTATGWKILNIADVDRLTFKGGTMVATDTDNKTLLSVDCKELETMVVTDNTDVPAGVDQVTSNPATQATFTYDATTRCIVMKADGALEIYRADGARIDAIPQAKAGEVIEIEGVGNGIIIVKSGAYTLKVALK